MKKSAILLILLAAVIFTAGCTEERQENPTNTPEIQENSTNPQETQEKSVVIEVTELEQINTSLLEGPILMKIGSERCGPCKDMKPMLQELATEYGGKAKVIAVDIDRSPQLAVYFGIGYIPDSTVIMNVTDGEYVYMKPDGKVTTDRFKARITGLTEKGVFEDVLNLALLQAEKDKS